MRFIAFSNDQGQPALGVRIGVLRNTVVDEV